MRIDFKVSGKIRKIVRDAGSGKPDLEFMYDPSGNRIAKIVKPNGTTDPSEWTTTYFVRDVSGNIMAVYDKRTIDNSLTFKLKEQPIYGSSRIGNLNSNLDMSGSLSSSGYYSHFLGMKNYEGVNHLGNVNAVFSDIKIPRSDDGISISSYMPDVVSSTDYYPFGMVMPERSFGGGYRFGFNGKENDDEVKGGGNSLDFGARIYDARIGRWMSVDPQTSKMPNYSPYAAFANNPIYFVDPNGEIPIVPILLAAWAVTEIALSVYDAYETANTLMDPKATTSQKVTQASLFAGGLLFPGGGYGTMGKAALSKIDDALVLAKSEKTFRGLKPAVDVLENAFENKAASIIAERGDKFIGFSDKAVRKVLGIQKGNVADFLSVSNSGKFNITEVKGSIGSSGADISTAMKQLTNTFEALKTKLPKAELGNVEIILPKGGAMRDGYSVSGNQLIKMVDGKPQIQKVGGKAVQVTYQ